MFPDLENHWAKSFILALREQNIISGYKDGTFKPDQAMSRAQFAAVMLKAFPSQPKKRDYVPFKDVPGNYWAAGSIQFAFERGFLSGFPDGTFQPEANITKAQILTAIVLGLDVKVSGDLSQPPLNQIYDDAGEIPRYASNAIAIGTRAKIIVNYPSVKNLRVNQIATRAEIVSIIYQSLVYLGKSPMMVSEYIVDLGVQPTPVDPKPPIPIANTVKVNHQRELRGVWVAGVWNLDWPSKVGLSSQEQQRELINIIERIEAANCNALFLQVRPEGDALYNSAYDPWSAWLTGTPGRAPTPLYDPLELAINECHKRNIECHAWFNPYRAKSSVNTAPNVRPHLSVTNPEVVYRYGNQLWMDPGSKIVQDRTYNVIMDVVKRYDVDGIHLDDYFYPYPIKDTPFPDQRTYQGYRNGGGGLSLADWRRANVDGMVERLFRGIRAQKPFVKFGISPFGIYRPGFPPQVTGLDAYNVLYADSVKWLRSGWVDYLAPQLYWRVDQVAQSYPVLLKWWTEQNPLKRHIYAGNNLAALDSQNWSITEIERQIDISRNLVNSASLGNIFFSMKMLLNNEKGVFNKFKSIYDDLALVPQMPWIKIDLPRVPGGVKVNQGLISWDKIPDVRSWTLYKRDGNSWKLVQIINGDVTNWRVSGGTYAVCAVDRLGNESDGLVVQV